MSQGTVVPFADVTRARAAEPNVVDALELRARQRRILADDCHVVFDRITVTNKMKTQEIPVFQDLSIGFPKGRKIAVLGHRTESKEKITELIHNRTVPRQGNVIVNSRVSWPVQSVHYMDPRASTRENMIFLARVMGIQPAYLIGTFLEFCRLGPEILREPLKNVPDWARKRMGLLVLFACGFDCLLVNGQVKTQAMKLDEGDAAHVIERLFSYDYIAMCDKPRLMPGNCDLVYLVHEGTFYEFEDIDEAVAVFSQLPEPKLGPADKKDDDEMEDDELQEMMI